MLALGRMQGGPVSKGLSCRIVIPNPSAVPSQVGLSAIKPSINVHAAGSVNQDRIHASVAELQEYPKRSGSIHYGAWLCGGGVRRYTRWESYFPCGLMLTRKDDGATKVCSRPPIVLVVLPFPSMGQA